MSRLQWSQGRWAESGVVGGLSLFTVGYGSERKEAMYYMATTLPVRHSLIGQHYMKAEHAKEAAERLLAIFLRRIGGAA